MLNLTVKTHCYVVVTKQLPSFCSFPFLNVIEYNFQKLEYIPKYFLNVFIKTKTLEKTSQYKSQAIQYKRITS